MKRALFLLAVAVGLLILAFKGTGSNEDHPARKFADGERVHFIPNPLMTGYIIGAVWDATQGWVYTVSWDSGAQSIGLQEKFLESSLLA